MPAIRSKTEAKTQGQPPNGKSLPLDPESARELAGLFKIFAGETRLRLLHALLRGGEVRVLDLAESIGMPVQAVSNQLQLLAAHGIVAARREGASVHYRVDDPCVQVLLSRGLCLLEESRRRT